MSSTFLRALAEEKTIMRTVLIAAAGLMALTAGSAFAEGGGGGNGGSSLYDDAAGAPPGFFAGVPGYDNHQEMETYVVRQQNAWLAARQKSQSPVAQTQTPSNG
jgi:hypothetical protein